MGDDVGVGKAVWIAVPASERRAGLARCELLDVERVEEAVENDDLLHERNVSAYVPPASASAFAWRTASRASAARRFEPAIAAITSVPFVRSPDSHTKREAPKSSQSRARSSAIASSATAQTTFGAASRTDGIDRSSPTSTPSTTSGSEGKARARATT